MKRAHIGCGSIRPDGWDNFDVAAADPPLEWDVRDWPGDLLNTYDYAVCSFMLQELDFHELPDALCNIRAAIKPKGHLRVLVVDILHAFDAYEHRNEGWFPQDDRTGGLDEKFCSFLTWYGTSKSVFTPRYLHQLLRTAGFSVVCWSEFGKTSSPFPEITELDSRPKEALVFEAVK